ncbi:MAG: 6,7-dimethyl-8-ribityllumazine synthase [Candidatus Saccharimonadales bacterium]|nr:6,7-dimethyl-8-ribityllumazine synthase [Candidatus Saccharimonadales bacterium]
MANAKNAATLKAFDASDWHVGVVVARFNHQFTVPMKDLALKTLTAKYKVKKDNVTIIEVAGSADMPAPLEVLARNDLNKCLITIGAVIKGETVHNQYVSQIAVEAIKDVAIKHAKPIAFGIITADNEAQAKARAEHAAGYVDAAMHAAKAIEES